MAFGYPFSRLCRQLPRPHPSACGCHLPQRGYVACWGLESSTAVVSPDHGPLPPLRGTFSVRGEGCASCLARMFCRRARAPSRLPQEKGTAKRWKRSMETYAPKPPKRSHCLAWYPRWGRGTASAVDEVLGEGPPLFCAFAAQRMRRSSLLTRVCFSMWKLFSTGSPPFSDRMK